MNRLTAQLLDATIQTATEAAVDQAPTRIYGEILSIDTGAHTISVDYLGVTLYGVPYSSSLSLTVGHGAWLDHQGARVTCVGTR